MSSTVVFRWFLFLLATRELSFQWFCFHWKVNYVTICLSLGMTIIVWEMMKDFMELLLINIYSFFLDTIYVCNLILNLAMNFADWLCKFLGHYREHLIEDCIFFCMETHMGRLLVILYGIFRKKFTSQRRHCERWWLLYDILSCVTNLLPLLWYKPNLFSVCRICFKICHRRLVSYLFCWKCSYGPYGYTSNRESARLFVFEGIFHPKLVFKLYHY